jgi:hypothetical protein
MNFGFRISDWRLRTASILLLSGIFARAASTNGFTVTVYRGYTFSPGELPTTEKLNQAGQPSLAIGGTNLNVPIGAKSIDGSQFTNSLPDGATLDFNGSVPRALEIKSGGVGVNQFNGSSLGAGLTGGSGSAVSVDFHSVLDTTVFGVTAGKLNFAGQSSDLLLGKTPGSILGTPSGTNVLDLAVTLPLAITPQGLALSTLVTNRFYGPGAGLYPPLTHNYGTVPRRVHWVMICLAAQSGWAVGDEMDIKCLRMNNQSDPNGYGLFFAQIADRTNVFLDQPSQVLWLINKTNGQPTLVTASDFGLKAYVGN